VFWQEYNCAGPIAFIGLAVPHIAKLVFQTSNHTILFWSTLLLERVSCLSVTVFHVPGGDITLPINAVTSVFGANSNLLVRKRK
jgi:iron complex transport system permease protein